MERKLDMKKTVMTRLHLTANPRRYCLVKIYETKLWPSMSHIIHE